MAGGKQTLLEQKSRHAAFAAIYIYGTGTPTMAVSVACSVPNTASRVQSKQTTVFVLHRLQIVMQWSRGM